MQVLILNQCLYYLLQLVLMHLLVGISFALLDVNIFEVVYFIGIITFILSVVGVKVGNRFGCKYESKAELFGGIILVLIGSKILFQHLL